MNQDPDINNPVHRICVKLNELFKLDPHGMHKCIETRTKVEDALADAEGITATMEGELGPLSFINAVMMAEFDGIIVACYDGGPMQVKCAE